MLLAYWVKQKLDSKDPNAAQKYKDELNVVWLPFVEKYGGEALAEKCLKETQELLERYDREVGPLLLGKEIAAKVQEVNNKSHWVTVMLDRKDPNGAQKYREELNVVWLPFVEKYGNESAAEKCLKETQAILDRFDKEVAPMILGNYIRFLFFY